MHISILKISNLSEISMNNLIKYISKEKRIKVNKFYKKEDKLRGIYGELLIRKMIMNELKISNMDISFESNKYGKPYLRGSEDLHFNISHSGEYVVCCIDSSPIGIDIEKIEPIDINGISSHFFTTMEQTYILGENHSNTFEERINRFYEIWTLKESFIKCIGMGLSMPLNEFSIYFDYNNEIILAAKEPNDKYFFKQIFVDNSYKMSICSKGNHITNNIIYIDEEHLISEFCKNSNMNYKG